MVPGSFEGPGGIDLTPFDNMSCACIAPLAQGQGHHPSSCAYGLIQALPASKMASARYGSPVGAWKFWQANGWY
ncbi:hypothetical protein GCM10009549_08090 [Streptomyces thermoalcalitolerans]|uniref:Transglycosylase SLT domain-containing protein n=2 Tax=Streptomyces TaxID=1883 RepID=A0ABN1NEU3_9ACTN